MLNPYTTVEGTSFSAPHLTGVIALLKSAVPTASHDDIRNALYTTALDLGAPGPDNVTGYGLVDAHLALLKLRCPAGRMRQMEMAGMMSCDNCTEYIVTSYSLDVMVMVMVMSCDADLNNDGYTDNTLDLPLIYDAFTQVI